MRPSSSIITIKVHDAILLDEADRRLRQVLGPRLQCIVNYRRLKPTACLQLGPSGFSYSKHTFEHVIAEGDRIVTVGTWTGTHTGYFQGIPATGKQVTVQVVHVDTISDGKSVEHNGEGDFLACCDS